MEKVEFPFDVKKLWDKCVRNQIVPKNDFEKQAVLTRIIKDFEFDKIYLEEEVNKKIKKYFEDFTFIRRELINFGYMQRNPRTGEYWVVKKELTKEDIRNNTRLRRHTKPFRILEDIG